MANSPVTPQQLINANADCKTLEDATNGAPEVEITSRLGRKFWTLATFNSRSQQLLIDFQAAINTIVLEDGVPAQMVSINGTTLDVFLNTKADKANTYTKAEVDALTNFDVSGIEAQIALKADKATTYTKNEVDTQLSNLVGGSSKFYPTLAQANADIANIAVNTTVTTGDEGIYYKESVTSTTLTKSPYDPVSVANEYTDYAIPTYLGLEVQEGRNIFDKTKIKNGFYLNPLGLTASGANFAIYVQEAKGGDVFFVHSNGEDLSSSLRVATKDSLTPTDSQKGSIVRPVLERDGWYKITVPASTTTQAIYLMIYSSAAPIVDFRETLQIQKDILDTGEVGGESIAKIAGYELEDTQARNRIRVLEEGGATTSKSRLDGKELIAFGDSITEGTEGGYVKHLSTILGVTVTNKGSSGATASRMFDIVFGGLGVPRRDAVTASTNWALIDYSLYDAITIQIGTNNTEAALGALTDIPATYLSDYANHLDYWALFPNNYVANIAACIELIKSKNSKCEIYLITPPHRNRSSGTDTYERYLKHKAALEGLSNYYGIPLISAITDSGISQKEMRTGGLYSYDGTHFNELGNEMWGECISYKIVAGG